MGNRTGTQGIEELLCEELIYDLLYFRNSNDLDLKFSSGDLAELGDNDFFKSELLCLGNTLFNAAYSPYLS